MVAIGAAAQDVQRQIDFGPRRLDDHPDTDDPRASADCRRWPPAGLWQIAKALVDLALDVCQVFGLRLVVLGVLPLELRLETPPDAPQRIAEMVVDHRISGRSSTARSSCFTDSS